MKTRWLILLALLAPTAALADDFPLPQLDLDTWKPLGYACGRAEQPPVIDGRLDDAAWGRSEWTPDFVDIRGGSAPTPRHRTRVKMLWDDDYLYIGADLEEPHLWATLTQRDAVIYHDNDFELFIDPDGDTHDYYELEINALGTVWDLLLTAPYRDGGHAVDSWDIAGLKSAVHLDGTLNDPSDTDRGWSVELALPWTVLEECAAHDGPPEPVRETWRVNFSRVQWQLDVVDGAYRKRVDPETGRPLPEDNWVWSPQGLVAMHYPEMWGFLHFGGKESGGFVFRETLSRFRRFYYAQKRYYAQTERYARDLDELAVRVPVSEAWRSFSLDVSPIGYSASGYDASTNRYGFIDDSGCERTHPGKPRSFY